MFRKTCFIRHRQILYPQAKERLKNAIQYVIDNGCRDFSMGTHGEFDSLALSECKSFRNQYKDIDIEVVLTSYHKIEKKVLFTYINDDGEVEEYLDKPPYQDVNTTMFEIEDLHFKRQITESNKQMIDGCDVMICYVDTKRYRSGAKTALNYAKRKGLTIINCYDEKDEPTYGMTKEEIKEYYDKIWEKIKAK